MTDKPATPPNVDDIVNLGDYDLAAAANEAKTMELVHPLEGTVLISNGKPMTIQLLGAKSKAFRAAVNNMNRIEQNRRVPPTPSIERDEERSAKLLSAAVVGWDNIWWPNAEGVPALLPFNRANAEMLLAARDWIRKQVDAFSADEKNYWTGPKKS